MFPINQYKATVVTTSQIASFNTRSVTLEESVSVRNMTRTQWSEPPRIVAACQYNNALVVLLSSGELVFYANQRILTAQQLSQINGELLLDPSSTSLQIIGKNLFIIDEQTSQLKIYHHEGGKYLPSLVVSLPHDDPITSY